MHIYSSNEDLIESIIDKGVLKSKELISAFKKVDRAMFLKEGQFSVAYVDEALPTLAGQTISQPYTVAFMFELLRPKKNDIILNVGSGSGWTVGLLSEIVGTGGHVTGTEIYPELVKHGLNNMSKFDYNNYDILQAQESFLGIRGGKFDKILVDASAMELPLQLVKQLKPKGTMVIPIGDSIVKVEFEADGRIRQEAYPGFLFVPLQ